MTWSPQQEAAVKEVRRWLKDESSQVFRLFGYAGTGKTTLAKDLAEGVKGKVLFGAFTGKAALMLHRKGCRNASTIHSMIYSIDEAAQGWEPKFRLNPASTVKDAKLVVIDEVSMVDEALAADLLSFGTKVLVLGDPAQLPPVKGTGYFTAADPDVMLTEVHRQARDNPIIAMSMRIREGGRLDLGDYGESRVIRREDIDAQRILAADQVLVGMNKTRRAYNDRIRSLRGMDPSGPQVGDKLVCLRNEREKKLLNGGIWRVESMGRPGELVEMLVTSEDHVEVEPTEIRVLPEFFDGREDRLTWEQRRGTQEFTYGYALTCHKAQGSQWDDVVVFDESSFCREDAWRWKYTAVTRAAQRVTVVQ
ncbi:ATP-dependent DNA helicase [Enterovirga rhinocerotis]|uniref:Exodeoxyribonuclease-5 n=1 Tax=Enterovirga rhinocerotis TaxID=1339210 RepID=A0A4R7BXU7_9HYPH|nr:ATP-dependent RecD-like DNA helicase [Enterovirga rhinocerotis]TDR90343.1 exodeoxyribonuclease-5 [Enterovirga rhinocerotis]